MTRSRAARYAPPWWVGLFFVGWSFSQSLKSDTLTLWLGVALGLWSWLATASSAGKET